MTKIKELRIKAEILETLDDQLEQMITSTGYDYRKDEESGEWIRVPVDESDLSEYDMTRLNLLRQIRKDLMKLI